MATKILKLNQVSIKGLDRLPRDTYEIASEFQQPDAILLRSHKLQEAEIPASVVGIARAGAGVNNIPLEFCTQRGIPVFNTPGANANAVKELVAAGLLLGSRGIIEGFQYVQTLGDMQDEGALNKLLEAQKKQFKGAELTGKTLGVVGLGAIGSMVAEMALTFGMKVVGYDPALSVEAAWRLSSKVRKASSLSSLFAQCEFISLHLPVLDTTRGLINGDLLNLVQPGTCLLNFARQEIVDTGSIVNALENGNLRKYIADFPTAELIKRDDVILMPHIGASTEEAEDNCAIMAADQLRDLLENGNIRNSVNFPSVQLEPVEGYRLAVTNDNVPKILGSILAILADENINVLDMLNKSRDQIAYNLIDLASEPAPSVLKKMCDLEGVLNVRLLS
ncbi:MAG: D-3-phosphoglycerate dehydrogenase [Halioglobus sp.]|jgi:D-3-phosphoglycerate dehydrogenase